MWIVLSSGKVDHGVAARVRPAEVVRLHVLPTEMHVELIGERDARQSDRCTRRVLVVRTLQVLQVGVDIPVRDHLGDRQHLEVAAGMVVVLVGVDDVLQRLVGDRLHLREDVGMVAIEHVVHEDDAVARGIERDVAPLARDHVQVALHLLGAKRARRLCRLRVHRPRALQHEDGDEETKERRSAHAREYTPLVRTVRVVRSSSVRSVRRVLRFRMS